MSSDFLNNEAFNNDNLVNALSRMRQGDVPLRERFTEENKNMIMKVVSQVLGKSAIPTNSKEYDAAITAFNYCIDHYDFNDSESFTTYSEKIIKEWIYHFLWEENSKGMSSVDPSSDNSKEYLYRNFENKDEIIIFKQKLWEFGITLRDLFFLGPREVDQIMFSLKVAISIAHNKELYKRMFIIKAIPIDDLDERYKVQKKLIEKNKEYIIALSIILKSDLKVLKSYLINIDQGKPTENIGIILELFKKDAIVMNFSGQFIIIKVDRSNNRIIGKQVQLNKDGSKLYYNKILKFAGIAAGSAAIIMLVVFGSKLFLNKSADTIAPPPSSKVIILDEPTPEETAEATGNIESTETIEVSPTPAVVEQTESPKAASPLDSVNNPEDSETVSSPDDPTATPEQPKKQQATNTKPARPTHTTKKETPRKLIPAAKPSLKPTTKPSASAEVPKIAGAKDVPETVQISSDTYSVKVGDYFSLSMNMLGGNNGSTLILYENNEVISSTPIADNTPYPQSRTVAIIAERRGIFNYKWKLVNDFGSSSSGTLTMIVTD
jgi:RNA polymerase sigma-I factor